MSCIINPTSELLFKYQPGDSYFVNNKSEKCYEKDDCLSYKFSPLPLMAPPTSASINTHFHTNFNMLINSSFESPSLQSILNPNFIKSTKENYIQPIYDSNLQQVILPVECGQNYALMYLKRLCQGSKGPCILFKTCYWLTPNEFQYISGRETAKDWKRSIRHNGKSIKLLINKGILGVHSPLCECGTATSSFMKIGRQTHSSNDFSKYSTDSSESSLSVIPVNYGISSYNSNDDFDSTDTDQQREGADWDALNVVRPKSETSVGDVDSLGISSPRSFQECNSTSIRSRISSTNVQSLDGMETEDQEEHPTKDNETFKSASSPDGTATESQSEETSVTGSTQTGGNNNNNNNNNESSAPPVKSKRKSKQSIALKSERQSPQLSSSTTSPPMTPPPSSNSTGHNNPTNLVGSSPPPPPIKQMEQMMTSSARNYSDFMRSLAAKYNQQQSNLTSASEYYSRASPAANFAFDTRFLKPAAAAALLNLSCSQIPSSMFGGGEKEKFPMIDMSSTQTLLSMVRSASAAAANNLESLKTNSQTKRPNSPLDLSSRDLPSTPPPFKKSKLRNPSLLDVTLKAATTTPCLSSCSTGCTEEAQAMINWSVEDVCRFVSSIDLCKDYVEIFREHSIDGSSLPLLTEEHLMNSFAMKLGPALKFRSTVARKLGNCVICSHCTHCHSHNNNNNNSNSNVQSP